MKTGHNQEGIGLDQKKERIGKFFRARSPESLKRVFFCDFTREPLQYLIRSYFQFHL